jgi:hypothetical protein
MIICEKCANFSNCECVPYDVECDNNFKEKVGVNDITDAQIIKALECCLDIDASCDDCPFRSKCDNDEILFEYVVDLINRQQADIRKLQLENEKLEIKLKGEIESSNKSRYSAMEVIKKQDAEIDELIDTLNCRAEKILELEDNIKSIKAEAIKEFAERLKEHAYLDSGITGFQEMVVDLSDIENIADEMVGEE